jgi:hypothetical protein
MNELEEFRKTLSQVEKGLFDLMNEAKKVTFMQVRQQLKRPVSLESIDRQLQNCIESREAARQHAWNSPEYADFVKFWNKRINNEKGVEDLRNDILYKTCRTHFRHKNNDTIFAKISLIRSVAMEREQNVKNKEVWYNGFDTESIISALKNSEIDHEMNVLKKIELSPGVRSLPLSVYAYLLKIIEKSVDSRIIHSFWSNYLHFHLPQLFFIYDDRTEEAISKHDDSFLKMVMSTSYCRKLIHRYSNQPADQYARFFCKCIVFRQELFFICDTKLTPREMDKILLDY